MTKFARLICVQLVAGFVSAGFVAHAAELDAALQAKLDACVHEAQNWAANPAVVNAVKTHNTSPPAEAVAMTQDKWKSASVLDAFPRGLAKNPAAEFLKSKNTGAVTEAFISGAEGMKVAFLSKPTNWSHKGKAKHEQPMVGKTWQGQVEVDESTGQQQVQIAVPVLDGGKPIGSLVVGFSVNKLHQ